MNKSWKIPRRTFLKGAGVSILLPLLDIMEADAAVSQSSPRFVAIFNSTLTYGLGCDISKNDASRYYSAMPWAVGGMGAWAPRSSGAFTSPLPPGLAPLESLKQKISIVSGMATLAGDPLGRASSAI